MGKRGHWKVAGYDGSGEAIRVRRVSRLVEPERTERDVQPHRDALRRMFAKDEQREQDRAVRDVLGLSVR